MENVRFNLLHYYLLTEFFFDLFLKVSHNISSGMVDKCYLFYWHWCCCQTIDVSLRELASQLSNTSLPMILINVVNTICLETLFTLG